MKNAIQAIMVRLRPIPRIACSPMERKLKDLIEYYHTIRQPSQDEILRAVASSTAIETGQRIEDIEAALRGEGSNLPLVQLADTPQMS